MCSAADRSHPVPGIDSVLSDVADEIVRGIGIHGSEHTFTAQDISRIAILSEEVAEVFEAVAMHDDRNLYVELVQVAAVASSWAAAMDRRMT